jgi:hypothetical protein
MVWNLHVQLKENHPSIALCENYCTVTCIWHIYNPSPATNICIIEIQGQSVLVLFAATSASYIYRVSQNILPQLIDHFSFIVWFTDPGIWPVSQIPSEETKSLNMCTTLLVKIGWCILDYRTNKLELDLNPPPRNYLNLQRCSTVRYRTVRTAPVLLNSAKTFWSLFANLANV